MGGASLAPTCMLRLLLAAAREQLQPAMDGEYNILDSIVGSDSESVGSLSEPDLSYELDGPSFPRDSK